MLAERNQGHLVKYLVLYDSMGAGNFYVRPKISQEVIQKEQEEEEKKHHDLIMQKIGQKGQASKDLMLVKKKETHYGYDHEKLPIMKRFF